jgi:hypothetical protein
MPQSHVPSSTKTATGGKQGGKLAGLHHIFMPTGFLTAENFTGSTDAGTGLANETIPGCAWL